MRLTSFFRAAFFAFSVLALASCGGGSDSKVDKNQTFATSENEQLYVSPFFGMSVEKPSGWYAMSAEEFAEAMGLGAQVVAGNDEHLMAVLNASNERSANIFAFYEHEVGAAVSFNPNVLAVAENVRFAPGVKTGKDYFFHMKQLADQSAMSIQYLDTDETRMIAGVNFDQLDGVMSMMGQQINQRYYAARQGNHVIIFILTYQTEEQLAPLHTVLDSMSLEE